MAPSQTMDRTAIAPSLLAFDRSDLPSAARELTGHGITWMHIDIMDGEFVPNLALDESEIVGVRNAIAGKARLDCHIMVWRPEEWVERLCEWGADSVTFHIEAAPTEANFLAIIEKIANKGKKCGVAIKPHTPPEPLAHLLEKYAHKIDKVLIMTVEPGRSGQAFMPHALAKIGMLRTAINNNAKNNNAINDHAGAHPRLPRTSFQADGGVSLDSIKAVKDAGVTQFVVGSTLGNAPDKLKTINNLETLIA